MGDPAGTHCARSEPARSPRRRLSGCAGSSWRGPGGPRCTGAAGGRTRPSRSARAARHPRRLGGARLQPARGRPGPGRGPRRTGSERSAWHLPRARGSGRRSGGEGAGGWAAAGRACGAERAEAGWPRPSRQEAAVCSGNLGVRLPSSDGAAARGRRPYIARLTRDTEHFLSGLHQPSAPHTHPLTPRPRLSLSLGPARVTPPRPPRSGGGGGPASPETWGELLPAARGRGLRPGRSRLGDVGFAKKSRRQRSPAPRPRAPRGMRRSRGASRGSDQESRDQRSGGAGNGAELSVL